MENAIIYHYTSAPGIQGILENKNIRLTNTKYLNDSQELLLGIDMAKEALNEALSNLKEESPPQNGLLGLAAVASGETSSETTLQLPQKHFFADIVFAQVEAWLDTLAQTCPFYTASFCKEGDNLRQWMSYCPRGGYAIGFDAKALKSCQVNGRSPHLRNVDYSYESKLIKNRLSKIEHYSQSFSDFANTLLTQGNLEKITTLPDYENFTQKFKALALSVARLSLIHKAPCFKDERETRLIFSNTNRMEDEILFPTNGVELYPRGNLLIPYVEAKFPMEAVKEIVIGPMPNQDLAKHSLALLKKKHGFSFRIHKSDISLRPL